MARLNGKRYPYEKSASALSPRVVPTAWASVGAVEDFPIKAEIPKSDELLSLVGCPPLPIPYTYSVSPSVVFLRKALLAKGNLVYGSVLTLQRCLGLTRYTV